MKNRKIIPINLINITVIISIMIFIALLTQNIINELTFKDIENVTKLTQTNINAEITRELIEPVNTSLIMAQNTFVFEFMDQETNETEEKLAKYLKTIQEATDYESVFLVPHSTLNYYHPGGTDAKVDLASDESMWYRERIEAEDDYAIVVNPEQLDNWEITMYVDAIMRNDMGEFVGITGVGKRITHLQDVLIRYRKSQDVEAYLTDGEGVIQIHPNEAYIENKTFYELENISMEDMLIENSKNGLLEKHRNGEFIIVQYLPMLKWHLVVTKSTSEFTSVLNKYSRKMYVALVIAVLMMMLSTSFIVSRYKKQIVYLSNIDKLTNVPNRTIFDNVFEEAIKNASSEVFSLAIFDIDNLKIINDSLGHDQGDETLKAVARIAKKELIGLSSVFRVGGDEFAIIIYKPIEIAERELKVFLEILQDDSNLKSVDATVSIGITESRSNDSKSELFKRADEALYCSKESGRNKMTIKM